MEETLEDVQARHRKEQRDLQGRITNKKKNATKKTRKGVADECAALERGLKEKHEAELAALRGEDVQGKKDEGGDDDDEVEVVAGTLADTSLADSKHDVSPSKATTPSEAGDISVVVAAASPAAGGGPKKRNRQKERLARRAADAEAASAAAEAEAATMTDHAAVERAAMEPVFDAQGRAEHEIQPDGHCLFAAVADQLALQDIPVGDGAPPYRAVRRTAATYIADHADDFAPFLDEELATHVAKMRDTAEWGGHTELMALARAYGVGIHVVQRGRTDVIPPGDGVEEKGAVWLAYYRHGYTLGEHYNSLRKKEP